MLHFRSYLEHRDRAFLLFHIVADTDDDPFLTLHFAEIPLRGIEDFPLREAAFYRAVPCRPCSSSLRK